MAASQQNDFNVNDFVRVVEDHTKDLDKLSDRVKALEDKLGTNEKIAETLTEASLDAVKMQTMFEQNFVSLLCRNESAREEIRKIITATDRSFSATQWRKFGVWIFGGAMFVFAQITVELVKWVFRLTAG